MDLSPEYIYNKQLYNEYMSHWILHCDFSQGIIDLNTNGNSATFFSYVGNTKK